MCFRASLAHNVVNFVLLYLLKYIVDLICYRQPNTEKDRKFNKFIFVLCMNSSKIYQLYCCKY